MLTKQDRTKLTPEQVHEIELASAKNAARLRGNKRSCHAAAVQRKQRRRLLAQRRKTRGK